jgi:hypothetical protein
MRYLPIVLIMFASFACNQSGTTPTVTATNAQISQAPLETQPAAPPVTLTDAEAKKVVTLMGAVLVEIKVLDDENRTDTSYKFRSAVSRIRELAIEMDSIPGYAKSSLFQTTGRPLNLTVLLYIQSREAHDTYQNYLLVGSDEVGERFKYHELCLRVRNDARAAAAEFRSTYEQAVQDYNIARN